MLRRYFFNSPVQSIPLLISHRQRHYFRNMSCTDLNPPTAVRGMTVLERSAFEKRISVPRLVVPRDLNFNQICSITKKHLLKMERFKPVNSEEYKITLHPLAVRQWNDLKEIHLEKQGLSEKNLVWEEMQLGYVNWKYDEILKAVLPADKEALTAFSKVGHVVHLNLKEHLLPYRKLIGQVIQDKIPGCKTVVNKMLTIDNTYRNFQMELLCGEEDYQISLKENGCIFEFDFSKVYWNSRLSTEHARIVEMLKKEDVLLDVYAGVGPFSIPAAKKGCSVLANDLNPESYKALISNSKKNKVEAKVKCYNKDGTEFIREDIKKYIISRNTSDEIKGQLHITMNLPALAVEHLINYVGLLKGENLDITHLPIVHVYCFAKGGDDKKMLAREMVENNMGLPLADNLREISFVRNVAPNKDMMRVSSQRWKMGKRNIKNRNQQKQVAKKVKNVFTVSQGKKSNVKKAKEVSIKLKKINVHDKREKADKNFKDLHAQIVSKKPEKKSTTKPLPPKNKTNTNTRQVETDLNAMQM